jgi:hypothetical protein
MYCPRCASTAIEGQRFCRSCGMNLGLILDALEGKRGPLDFELLKRDLRELGANLRSGFEGASNALRGTARLGQPPVGQPPAVAPLSAVSTPDLRKEIEQALRKVRIAHSRKYSLQQATLSLFSGGAMMAAWYFLLQKITNSGLIESMERLILVESGHEVLGIGMAVRSLWVLALIPVAVGLAHLFNGLFLAPRKQELEPELPAACVPPPLPPVEPLPAPAPPDPVSIVEEQTLRFERDRQ